MHNRNELIEKFVKRNYSNELEKVLENKAFDEDVKNFLLNILYKIGISYKDYQQVKQDVQIKEKFVNTLIENIKENCEVIKLVKPTLRENEEVLKGKTFFIDKEEKKIICYPIERKLLYCITKISANYDIRLVKDDLVNEALSELLVVGNCINIVEPIRDFNGYSWNIIINEIESIAHNLIYQNLIILLGYDFLDKKNSYKEIGEELQENLIKLAILLKIKLDSEYKQKIEEQKLSIEDELNNIKDNTFFIEELTKEKRKLTKDIKNIDEIINDKEKLEEEYVNRNEKLELTKKIFSMRVLIKIMKEERETKVKEIERLNNLMKPQNFIKYKEELTEKEKYLKLVEDEDYEIQIRKSLVNLQKLFLDEYAKKIKNIDNKQNLMKAIYEFRYYNMLPFDKSNLIWQVDLIEEKLKEVLMSLIRKSHELKLIDIFSKDEELDYKIIKNIFVTKIINLEELYIKITKDSIQLFDEDILEETVRIEKIDNKGLEVKLNRKLKLFN